MNDYDSEEINEMLEQVIRYENSKLSGVKIWFDSDNYIDIIDMDEIFVDFLCHKLSLLIINIILI